MSRTQSSLGFGLVCDLDGTVLQVFCNESVLPEPSRSFLSLIDPASVPKARSFLSLVQAEGATYGCNFDLREKGQSTTLRFLAYRDGDVISIVGANTRPGMNRICAELAQKNRVFLGNFFQAIAESQNREQVLTGQVELEEAQRLAQIGSWQWDPQTDAVTWSTEIARIAGVDPQLPVPTFKEHARFFTVESWDRLVKHVENTLRTGVPYKLDLEAIRANGSRAWIVARGEPIRDVDGRIIRLRGTIQDITPRKELEQRLREYENAVEGAEEMIAVVDREYRYVIANRAFLNQRNMTKDQVVGRLVSEVVTQGVSEKVIHEKLDECFQGRVVKYEMKYTYPDLGERDMFLSYFPIQGPTGIDRVACILQDITERKMTQLALQESEARERLRLKELETILETLPIAVLIAQDPECKRISANRAGYELLRVRPGGNISKDAPPEEQPKFRILRDGSDVPPNQLPIQLAIASRKPVFGVPEFVVLEDGSEHHFVANAAPLLRDDGTPYGAVGAVMDVSERDRAEQALRKSEEKFSKAFRQSPMALSLTSCRDHRYIEVNETFERTTGFRHEDLIGRTPFDINIWVNPSERIDIVARLLWDGSIRNIENRFRTRAGEIRTASSSVELIEIDGEPCMLAVMADITDLKVAQEGLIQQKRLTDAVLDTIPGILFQFDEHGTPVRWNKQAEEITGYSAKEISGMTIVDFHAGESRDLILETLRKCLSEGYAEIEANLRTKNGTEIPFYFSGARLNIEGKRHLVGVGIDISERQRAERELKELSQRLITAQEEERTRLARELHDDTSQRLALLAIQLQQLGNNLPQDKSQITDSLRDLYAQVTELAADVHRLSRRLHPAVLDRVGAVPAIRSLCEDVRRQSGIAVRFDSDDVPVPIPKDVSLCLFRVAEEALNNAVKHSGSVDIQVELRGHADEIRLRVSDSGRGFEIERADTGKGLGLVSMKERLRLVGGELVVKSRSGGTEIEARIPLAPAIEGKGNSLRSSRPG
jgi:PAS domain S-box-containing protein